MHRGKLLACLIVLASALAKSAQAAPIMYQESVSGDLPASGALPVFLLDLGLNTVSGTVSYARRPPLQPLIDNDSFAFMVPAGTQVTDVSVAMVDDIDARMYAGIWTLYRGSSIAYTPGFFGELLTCAFPFPPPAGPASCSAQLGSAPLPAQTYNFNSWAILPREDSGMASYTFSLTLSPVATVPEPGSVVLLGTGIVGLLARRGRHRSSTPKPRFVTGGEASINHQQVSY